MYIYNPSRRRSPHSFLILILSPEKEISSNNRHFMRSFICTTTVFLSIYSSAIYQYIYINGKWRSTLSFLCVYSACGRPQGFWLTIAFDSTLSLTLLRGGCFTGLFVTVNAPHNVLICGNNDFILRCKLIFNSFDAHTKRVIGSHKGACRVRPYSQTLSCIL